MRDTQNGKFVLVVKGSWRPKFYFKFAGSHDTGDGECAPYAQTTSIFTEAVQFKTWKQAERMRQLLIVKYDLTTQIRKIKKV